MTSRKTAASPLRPAPGATSVEALARLGGMLEDLSNAHASRSDAAISAAVSDRLGRDANISTLRRLAIALG